MTLWIQVSLVQPLLLLVIVDANLYEKACLIANRELDTTSLDGQIHIHICKRQIIETLLYAQSHDILAIILFCQ